MTQYSYNVRHAKTGQIIKGEAMFESEAELRKYLLEQDYIPLKIKSKRRRSTLRKIEDRQMSYICKQLYSLIKAGIDLRSALHIMRKTLKEPRMSGMILRVVNKIEEGKSFARAWQEENVESDLFVYAIASGERTGELGRILEYLKNYYDKKDKAKKEVMKQATYPILVMVVFVVVIGIVMFMIVPSFVDVFEQNNIDLPQATSLILAFSEWLIKYWAITLVVILSVVVGCIAYLRRNRTYMERVLFKLPVVGKAVQHTVMARFCEGTYILREAGIGLIEAMILSAKMTNYQIVLEHVISVSESIRQGASLTECLENDSLWPPQMVGMLEIGERCGNIDELLLQTSQYLEEDARSHTEQTMTLIGPLLTILLAILIGVAIMAIILPIFTLASGVM